MKQKNLILMVVAVGCGLVAALLTSQMSARQTKAETVDVLVASKDLAVGTMLTKEDLDKMVATKAMPKDALPPLYVQTREELIEKRLSRSVRVGETFNPQDLNKGGVVTLPQGMDMVALQINQTDAVAGFVTPGSRVDVLATARFSNRLLAFPLLADMLVLAVNQETGLVKDSNGTFPNLNSVSFAVTRDQALLLQLAKSRGCSVSLVLRHPDKQKLEEKWTPDNVLKLLQDGDSINSGNPVKGDGDPFGKGDGPPSPKATDTVKLPVASESLPAGTELTADLIKKFVVKDVPGPAPENAVLDLNAAVGKVLLKDVAANQWVPKAYVGDHYGKDVPKEQFAPGAKDGAEEPAPAVGGRRTHDVVVQTGTGHKKFRYEERGKDNWVLVGEVLKAGGDGPQAGEPTPAPAPEKAID